MEKRQNWPILLRALETERSIEVFQSYLKKYSLVLYQFEGG